LASLPLKPARKSLFCHYKMIFNNDYGTFERCEYYLNENIKR
jgi:hypothetical protein